MDEQKLKKKLNPEQYRIMREGGTEMPYISKYWDYEEHGVYSCAACGTILFASLNKFDAKTGWPTFTRPISKKSLVPREGKGENGLTEVTCAECESHLGELMGAEEYRINSICLTFTPAPEFEKEEEKEGEAESKEAVAQKTQAPRGKTFTLTIGGLVIGATLGASYAAMTCLPPETPLVTANTLPISTTTLAVPTPKVVPKVATPTKPGTAVTPTLSPASSTPPDIETAALPPRSDVATSSASDVSTSSSMGSAGI